MIVKVVWNAREKVGRDTIGRRVHIVAVASLCFSVSALPGRAWASPTCTSSIAIYVYMYGVCSYVHLGPGVRHFSLRGTETQLILGFATENFTWHGHQLKKYKVWTNHHVITDKKVGTTWSRISCAKPHWLHRTYTTCAPHPLKERRVTKYMPLTMLNFEVHVLVNTHITHKVSDDAWNTQDVS